jgi:hypothetical protein
MMQKLLSFLGHGRALEFFLGWLKINISVSIALSDLSAQVPVTADLSWYYSPTALAAPFFVMGLLQASGVMLNVYGYEKSWTIRAFGAVLAIFVWCLVLVKASLVGEATLAIPIAITCLPASAFLFYKAWNRLPIPGSAGLT